MSFLEHLDELRTCMIGAILCVAIGLIVSMVPLGFCPSLATMEVDYIQQPLKKSLENYHILQSQRQLQRKRAELRELGYKVTQATVSRDIKELRLLKVLTGRGTYKYALADKAQHAMSDRFVQIFVATVVSIEFAQNIIVIKTIPASANVAAEAVDGMHLKEVLGTMAGDNTVLVIVHNEDEALTVSEHFRRIIR